MTVSFNFSWLARAYYLRPNQDDVDDIFQFYFRCNSNLANEGTLYDVDCIIDLDLSDTLSLILRREDATMLCLKTMQNSLYPMGVSQHSDIYN